MSARCRRNCPEDECYCAEPAWAEMNDLCTGCGGIGECYCEDLTLPIGSYGRED